MNIDKNNNSNNRILVCTLNEVLKKKYCIVWIEKWRDELIIFINKKNEIKIFSSICPHFGGEIHYNFKENELRCKWHDWRFCSKSGKCLTHKIIGRLKNYDFKIEPGSLKNYESIVKNNNIYAILLDY